MLCGYRDAPPVVVQRCVYTAGMCRKTSGASNIAIAEQVCLLPDCLLGICSPSALWCALFLSIAVALQWKPVSLFSVWTL
jgi:hypothetical protein